MNGIKPGWNIRQANTGPGDSSLQPPGPERLRQEDCKFKAYLGYRVGSSASWAISENFCQNKNKLIKQRDKATKITTRAIA